MITPAVVMRPISGLLNSVNHKAPSGPAVMPNGCAGNCVGVGYSVTAPAVVITATLLATCSVNQRLLSEPRVIARGPLFGEIPMLNSVTPPDVVIVPI